MDPSSEPRAARKSLDDGADDVVGMQGQWPDARRACRGTSGVQRVTTILLKLKACWQLWVIMALPLAYIITFKYIPMVGVQIAFRDFILSGGLFSGPWVGLKHFNRFVNSHNFWIILRNTLAISSYSIVAGFPVPIILAISLNSARAVRFRKTVQMLSYAPHFISTVVMVGIILEVLSPRGGIINAMLSAFGTDPVHFMSKPAYFSTIYVWSGVWQGMGFSSIIYLAALSAVDQELYSAATIDGATRIQKIRHIEIPAIIPTAVILLILRTGSILEVGFEKIYLMQNPLNLEVSEVIATYVYRIGLGSSVVNFSYASAIDLFRSLVGMVLLLSVNFFARRLGQAGLF